MEYRARYIILVIVLLIISSIVIYWCNPMDTWWMPRCWWRQLTGTDCPSCGTLRAAHAMMHGRMAQAFDFNPFLFVGFPLLGYVVWCEIKRRYRSETVAIAAYVLLYFAWWIYRNVS